MKKINIKITATLTLFVLICFSCTKLDNLDTKPLSRLTTEEFYNNPKNVENAQSLLIPALRSFGNGEQVRINNSAGGEIVNLFSGESDGNINYMKDAYLHIFDGKKHDARYNRMWNTYYNGITEANLILFELASITTKSKNIRKVNADIKVARAFFFLHAMDSFGNIPLDTLFGADPNTIKTNSRAEVFAFIEKELKENIPFLDLKTAPNNRINKYVGFTLLAQLYLGAQVYTGTARWADVIPACDSIMRGPYSLTPNYFDNFAADNALNENILVSVRDETGTNTSTFIPENVGGNGSNGSGSEAIGITGRAWNAFVSTAEMYDIYDNNDLRKNMWLVGPQRKSIAESEKAINGVTNTGDALLVNVRGVANPYSYAKQPAHWGFVRVTPANPLPLELQQLAGIRNVKYYPRKGLVLERNQFGNDYVIMRLADVILMKAEALMRIGNAAGAKVELERVRARAYRIGANSTVLNPTLKDIRDERTRELMWENYSRRDNIRFQVAEPSTDYWSKARPPLKPNADVGPIGPGRFNNMIYPIPLSQFLLFPTLTQNPGYDR